MDARVFHAFVDELTKEGFSFQKNAASAPTRGNFMMASDLPAFRSPSLRSPIQKDSEFLPNGVTYDPSDFKPVNPMKKRAVASSPAGRLAHSKSVGAPRTSAPPGPSIAEIAKPKGPGFGTGIAGANKGVIGGTIAHGFK